MLVDARRRPPGRRRGGGRHPRDRSAWRQRLRGICQAFQEYKQLKLLKNPIKGIYILLFLLMTLIIVFSATWFGLYLARGITEPIADAGRGHARGGRGQPQLQGPGARATTRSASLVDSFNRMTGDLGAVQAPSSRRPTSTSRPSTPRWRTRRRYTETVLEAVATGVVSLDPRGRVTTINGAAERHVRPRRGAQRGPSCGERGVPPARVRGDRHPRPAHGAAAARARWSARCTCAATAQAVVAARLRHRAARGRTASYMGMVLVVRRPHRAAQGPAPGRLARGGPAHRPRDQEPAHAHPALRPAPAAAAGPATAAPRRSACSRRPPPPSSRRWTGSSSWWTSSRASRACPRFAAQADRPRAARSRAWPCSTASRIPALTHHGRVLARPAAARGRSRPASSARC